MYNANDAYNSYLCWGNSSYSESSGVNQPNIAIKKINETVAFYPSSSRVLIFTIMSVMVTYVGPITVTWE